MNIIYIDDNIDLKLEKFLHSSIGEISHEKCSYKYLKFISSEGYLSLIDNPTVKEADIIILDSKLFRNNHTNNKKISGEEIKIVLKKIYPFKEVLVISRNDYNKEFYYFQKYKKSGKQTSDEYYKTELLPKLKAMAIIVEDNKKLLENLNKSPSWGKMIKDRINNSMRGKTEYDDLTKNDIDELISIVRKVEKEING